MSLRVERDPQFWLEVASHPAVAGLMGVSTNFAALAQIVGNPAILPLAAEHGGFLFVQRDSLGRVLELHTLFTPEGWGREVHGAAKEAFSRVFRDADLVFTAQMEANSRSQPPRSFGFRPIGEFVPTSFGSARTWILTGDAWKASPGARSQCH